MLFNINIIENNKIFILTLSTLATHGRFPRCNCIKIILLLIKFAFRSVLYFENNISPSKLPNIHISIFCQ